MSVQFSFNRSEDGNETIIVIGSRGIKLVPSTHVNFDRVKASMRTLMEGGEVSEEETFALADAAQTVTSTLRRLSERVTLKNDKVFFDGDEVSSRLTQHIVDMIRNEDDNWEGYVAFLENLSTNPSGSGRQGLFEFLERHDLLITEDGCFVAYKAVSVDGKSIHSGAEDVTITYQDGHMETVRGRIPNPVGATIEMPRSLIDSDQGNACSVGLHVANHHFASTFGGAKFMTVKVNPRDVVAVPHDSGAEKIRTARYVVIEENEGRTRYEGTSYIEDDDFDAEYDPFDDVEGCGSGYIDCALNDTSSDNS